MPRDSPLPMFRLPFLVALALLTTFGLGVGSAVMMLNASSGFGAIRLGAWQAFPDAQLASADPYARSHRARAGRLLLGSAEGLQFQASVDDDGRGLNPACIYEIRGETPPARFWTLFAANRELDPIVVDEALPSALNSRTVLRNEDGSFVIHVAAKAQPGNWLTIPPAGSFKLVLTLLDTPAAGSSRILEITMPK
ncbi:MAG: hypothetical protein RLZZ444_2181, partial [Pseudomonadota bacterium]